MRNKDYEVSKQAAEGSSKTDISELAFDLIGERVGEVLLGKGFKKEVVKRGESMVFRGKDTAYAVFFDKHKKICELRLSNDCDDDFSSDTYSSISKWLFDKDKDTIREVREIADDFCSSLTSEDSSEVRPRDAKRRKKSSENNADTLFFVNRIANIFPEIKPDLQYEKNNHEDFRAVTFTRDRVVPVVNEFLKLNPDKTRLKKLGNVLSDMYHSGNLDVRGLITIVILNSITEDNEPVLRENLSEELKNMWTASKGLKGKTIKPEKVKKKKSFISDTLLSGK